MRKFSASVFVVIVVLLCPMSGAWSMDEYFYSYGDWKALDTYIHTEKDFNDLSVRISPNSISIMSLCDNKGHAFLYNMKGKTIHGEIFIDGKHVDSVSFYLSVLDLDDGTSIIQLLADVAHSSDFLPISFINTLKQMRKGSVFRVKGSILAQC